MLEVGNYYTGKVVGARYKCLEIKAGKAEIWVHVDISPENQFLITKNNGIPENAKTLSCIVIQDLKYQDQYVRLDDQQELRRLTKIFNEQYQKDKPLFSTEAIPGMDARKFSEIMEKIDKELQLENPRIPGREIRAMSKVSKEFNIAEFPLKSTDVFPGVYTADNIATHVYRWFEEKYGNKLNMENNLAHMILSIKGVQYKVGFPILYGTMQILFDPTMRKCNSLGQKNNPAQLNLAAYIEDLTPKLASALTESEIIQLVTLYGSSYNAILRYLDSGLPLQQEVLADLESAVDAFFYVHQQYGQSKWASLQFTEKLLKGFIQSTGNKFQYSHELQTLAKQASDITGIIIDSNLIQQIECKAAVRYSATLVSVDEAIKAHHASLGVLQCMMNFLDNEGIQGHLRTGK